MVEFKQLFESKYTWHEGFMRNVRRYANKTAVIDPLRKQTLTYSQLNREASRLAVAVQRDGFKQGDVIMIMLKNCQEFVFAYIAAHKTRGVCCPVSFRLSAGELAYAIDDAQPHIFIYDAQFAATVDTALQTVKHAPQHILVAGAYSDGMPGMAYADYVATVKDEDCEMPEIAHNIYDETLRLYTSGTTGRPKAVPILSINEVLSAHDVMMQLPMNADDTTMNTTPWFHRGGIHSAGPGCAFYAGATVVIMDKFAADRALEYVEKYGITYVIGVPTVLDNIADEQERNKYNISSIRGFIAMGSPLERESCLRYERVLTPNIFNGYGTTETFWNTMLRPHDILDHAGSAGRSCTDDDVRVVKLYDDREAEPDDTVAMDNAEVGEVIICSPAKSPYRYHDGSLATQNKFYKGFVYTNDLATWDKDQFITILGRKDDMIISSGENIYPAEIESVLDANDKVKDSIVTYVPDAVRGQKVVAYVVPSDKSLTAEELDAYCKASHAIANFKRPRLYRFVDRIPENTLGKKMHVHMKDIARNDLQNGRFHEV